MELQSTEELREPWRCSFDPPTRYWYQTANGWASREWEDGEKACYAREVLGR